MQGIVRSVGDEADVVCAAKVIDEWKGIDERKGPERIWLLDVVVGMSGKLIFAAVSG